MSTILPSQVSADISRAKAVAEVARDDVFGKNFYDVLVAAIPGPSTRDRYELTNRVQFRELRARVAQFKSPSALGKWLRCDASSDEAICVAWGLANVIGQVEECRLNGGVEDPLSRYSDLLTHRHPVQVCLFGLDYLIFIWD